VDYGSYCFETLEHLTLHNTARQKGRSDISVDVINK